MIIKLNLDNFISARTDIGERSEEEDLLTMDDFIAMSLLFYQYDIESFQLGLGVNWDMLEKHGYVKQTDDDIILRDKGTRLFGTSADTLLDFVRKYRDLFPKGVRTGGYLVRADEAGVAEKMRKFLKVHKYTEEEILEATRRYVEERRQDGWKYMKTASYFIYKDGQSALASFCEQSKEGEYGESDTDWTRNVK